MSQEIIIKDLDVRVLSISTDGTYLQQILDYLEATQAKYLGTVQAVNSKAMENGTLVVKISDALIFCIKDEYVPVSKVSRKPKKAGWYEVRVTKSNTVMVIRALDEYEEAEKQLLFIATLVEPVRQRLARLQLAANKKYVEPNTMSRRQRKQLRKKNRHHERFPVLFALRQQQSASDMAANIKHRNEANRICLEANIAKYGVEFMGKISHKRMKAKKKPRRENTAIRMTNREKNHKRGHQRRNSPQD